MAIQIVGYWEDATEFPFGPYVACRNPMDGTCFRLEKRIPSGNGTAIVSSVETRDIPGYTPGWKSLEEISPIIEHLNAKFFPF